MHYPLLDKCTFLLHFITACQLAAHRQGYLSVLLENEWVPLCADDIAVSALALSWALDPVSKDPLGEFLLWLSGLRI